MGLSEDSDYAADKLTSDIYVTTAGAKDVGKYRWNLEIWLNLNMMKSKLNSYNI